MERDARELLESRMWNWARWSMQDYGKRQGACRSAEHMYRHPREDEERLARAAQEPVDVRDACKVEDAMLQLSKGRREFLRAHYVYRTHPLALARQCNLRAWMLTPTLWATLGALQYHLEHTSVRKVVERRPAPLAPPLYVAHTPCTI